MERIKLYTKFLAALIIGVMLIQGCSKEKGYYSTPNLNSGTDLNIYDYLKSKPGVYDSLLLLVDQLGLEATLRDSNITLFAVSNQSFQIAIKNLNISRKAKGYPAMYLRQIASGQATTNISKDIAKAKADSAHIDTMVSLYIIKGQYKSEDFSIGDGQNLQSIAGNYPMHGKQSFADAQGYVKGGSEIIEFSNTKRSVFIPNWAKGSTNSVNIKAKNGIVHTMRPDHVFGFDEFVSRLILVPPPTNLFKTLGSTFDFWFEDPNEFDGRVSPGEKFVKVHDGNVLTKFLSGFNPNGGRVRMQWNAPEPIVSNVYTMTSANDAQARDPRSWRLEGSMDGETWTTLDTRQDQVFDSRFETRIFDFNNNIAWKHYRMWILTNRGDGLFQLAEWTMNFRQTYE
jgi:hypothetical protein